LNAETLDPRYAHTFALKGDIHFALGRYGEAKVAYRRAIDEDVCPLRAITALRTSVIDIGREMNVPVVDFDSIISERSLEGITGEEMFLDHVHPTIEGHKILALEIMDEVIKRGLVRSFRPMTEEGIKSIEEIKMSQVDRKVHAEALINLAMLANWGGKFRKGRTLALRAIDLDPEYAGAYYQAGLSTMKIGEHVEEAITYFKKSISMGTFPYDVYVDIGEAYRVLGKLIEAQMSYLLAIENGDETVQSHAHFGLGEIYEKLNQLKNAIEQYELAIKIDPDFYYPRKRLEILKKGGA